MATEQPTPIRPHSKLSHEIRGCIQSLWLSVAAIETGPPEAEVVEFLADIVRTAQQLQDLLDEVVVKQDD